jgi:hypothetical protein
MSISSASKIVQLWITNGCPRPYLNRCFLIKWDRRWPVYQVARGVSSFSLETLVHLSVGQHATSLGDNGPVHALSHTVLLRSIRYGVVPDNAFLPAIIIKRSRTKFSTIISMKHLHLSISLPFYHHFPIFKWSKGIIFIFQKVRSYFSRVVVTPSFKGKTECIDHVCVRIKLHTRIDIMNTKNSATWLKSYYKP